MLAIGVATVFPVSRSVYLYTPKLSYTNFEQAHHVKARLLLRLGAVFGERLGWNRINRRPRFSDRILQPNKTAIWSRDAS
jgi:hypothetical protein